MRGRWSLVGLAASGLAAAIALAGAGLETVTMQWECPDTNFQGKALLTGLVSSTNKPKGIECGSNSVVEYLVPAARTNRWTVTNAPGAPVKFFRAFVRLPE